MRCVACNDVLPEHMGRKKDGSDEDLCSKCRFYALRQDMYDPKQYQLEGVTDNLKHSSMLSDQYD